MSTRARRVLALSGVAALHAGALFFLVDETRTHLLRRSAGEAAPMLAMLLQQLEPRRGAPRASERRSVRLHAGERRMETGRTLRPPDSQAAPGPTAIDWTAEAEAAAARQVEGRGRGPRPMGVMPPPSPMFAPPRRPPPGIAWDFAATHRVQPLGGLATAINVNDNCGIVLFIIIPFAGGCSIGKIPARGDLFDHMHDDRPAAEP